MGKRLHRLLHSEYLGVWEVFASEVNGTWNTPGYGDDARIEVPHAHGPIIIESDVTMIFTGKVMVPVVSTIISAHRPSHRGHRFSVSRANFATSVAEWFGSLDIHVDDAEFDNAFVLKGETPDFVRLLFADATLRERFRADFEGTLALKDDTAMFTDPTPGIDPLELAVSGIVDDPTRLRTLYTLFAATLDRVVLTSA